MADKERSLIAYEYYRESLLKFEYFFTGLIGVFCAYISQNFTVDKIGISPNTLELVSFLIFVISFGLSLSRLSGIVQGYKLNHRQLHLLELKGTLRLNLVNNPEKSQLNKDTGAILSARQVETEIIKIDKELKPLESMFSKLNKSNKSLFSWRNTLFLLAFFILIASKIWLAYYNTITNLPITLY